MTHVLRLSLPFTLWIVGFSAIYALQGLSCSRHWPEGLDARTALILVAALFVLAQGILLAAILATPSPSKFLQTTTAVLGAAALGAAFWTALPVMAITGCD